jgi:hypothetical protein
LLRPAGIVVSVPASFRRDRCTFTFAAAVHTICLTLIYSDVAVKLQRELAASSRTWQRHMARQPKLRAKRAMSEGW